MARLTKEQMTEAMRNLDAQADEHEDLPRLLVEREIDQDGVVHIAEQSAIRSCLMIDGRDPRKLVAEGASLVQLSQRSRALMPTIMAAFLDGFLVGIDCERSRARTPKSGEREDGGVGEPHVDNEGYEVHDAGGPTEERS